jgi:hypothetical protein
MSPVLDHSLTCPASGARNSNFVFFRVQASLTRTKTKIQPPNFVFAPRESKNGAYSRVPAIFSGEYKKQIKGKNV